MKFFCEYCGNRIDAQVDHKCPNCGASYKKNNEFKKLQEEKSKQAEYNRQFREKVTNNVFKTFKFFSLFSIIPFIVFIIIFIIIIFTVSKLFKNDMNINIPINKNEVSISAEFNEFAVANNYKVKVTKYEVVEDIFDNLEEGYELVKFYLIVENTSDNRLIKENVNCIVDGIAQNNDFSSGYSDLPMFIEKGLTVKGTATFEVPKDAKNYDIKYGDNVTIHIEK